MDVAAELERLAALHAKGDLTGEQYEQAKAAVLRGPTATPDVEAARERVAEPPARKRRITTQSVFLGVLFTAFLFGFALSGAVKDTQKLAAPVLCRAPYDDHTRVDAFYTARSSGGQEQHLRCVSATGKVKSPGTVLVLLVLFAEAFVVLGVLAAIIFGPYLYRVSRS